jgi:urease alpha subunit
MEVIAGLGARHTSTQSRAVQKNEQAGANGCRIHPMWTNEIALSSVANGFHLKIAKVANSSRILHNNDLNKLYFYANKIKTIKTRRVK